MKHLFFPALAVGALLAAGCSHPKEYPVCGCTPPCPSGDLTLMAVPGWQPSPYCFGPHVEQPGQYQTYVINSLAELQAVNHCADSARIDFSRYTLLAGKTKTVACSYVASQRVEAGCRGLTYHVVVKPALCQAVSEVLYTTLVPKQPAGITVNFDVQVQP